MKTTAPPDPATRKPKFQPPPLACDAHCHVFGPAAKFHFAPNRSYTPPDAPFEDFQKLQSILGLERAVIVQATCHGTDNSAMLDAIELIGSERETEAVLIRASTISEEKLRAAAGAGSRRRGSGGDAAPGDDGAAAR